MSTAKCSWGTLISGNLKCMPIFAEVSRTGRQTAIEWSKMAIFSVFGHCIFETFRDPKIRDHDPQGPFQRRILFSCRHIITPVSLLLATTA